MDIAHHSESTSSVLEVHKRELHRWVPTPPTPSTTSLSLAHNEPSDSASIIQLQRVSSHDSYSATSLNADSPIDPAMLLFTAPTLPPAALTGEHVIGRRLSQRSVEQVSDPGSSYVRTEEPHDERRPGPVAVPPATASRTSTDAMSVTTSSTLPPSYRTNRSTKRVSQLVIPLPSFEEFQYPMPSGSTQPLRYLSPARRPGERKRSMDGGVSLEGGVPTPVTMTGRRRARNEATDKKSGMSR